MPQPPGPIGHSLAERLMDHPTRRYDTSDGLLWRRIRGNETMSPDKQRVWRSARQSKTSPAACTTTSRSPRSSARRRVLSEASAPRVRRPQAGRRPSRWSLARRTRMLAPVRAALERQRRAVCRGGWTDRQHPGRLRHAHPVRDHDLPRDHHPRRHPSGYTVDSLSDAALRTPISHWRRAPASTCRRPRAPSAS